MYAILKEDFKKAGIKFKNVCLADYSTVKIGGGALAVFPEKEEELIFVSRYLYNRRIKHRILGAMSNTLAHTDGYGGVVVFTRRYDRWLIEGDRLILSSGVRLAKITGALIENSLTGFEELVGIPGLIGGLVYENAGAFSKTISDIIESARVYDKSADEVLILKKNDMGLGYRRSMLSENRNFVLLDVTIKLERTDDREGIGGRIRSFAEKRRISQPFEYPSLGSVFKRPKTGFAGAYIENAGLKGYTMGGAMISEKHAGFIVNSNNAASEDFLALMNYAANTVLQMFGVALEAEIEVLE